MKDKTELPIAPNFKKAVVLPDCCGTCDDFAPMGAHYDESPPKCYRFETPRSFDFQSLCDGYTRKEREYPRSL